MMTQEKAYLVIDIGTGNVRVAVADQSGNVLHIERDNVQYVKDERYADALYFDPGQLWNQVLTLTRKALQQVPGVKIIAITACSQREGIVMIDKDGHPLLGMPNHDHRGREWEGMVADKHHVYKLTGRYPSSLFSALKVVGVQRGRPEIYGRFATMLSISDWALFQLSGVPAYEHSQASETLLYDIEQKQWSAELCALFGIDQAVLPVLKESGTVLSSILPACAEQLQLSPSTLIVVGGADTQLAIKSTQPEVGDIVIVSGTTTPVVRMVKEYIIDDKERTWTNRHVEGDCFIVEANAGVTGLNYQRLKEIFYPNEGYDVIEKELADNEPNQCVASLGSLVAEEKSTFTRGGFIFNIPVSHELTRAAFVRATLWDIACSIRENLETLCVVTGHTPAFVWACGGGFQSNFLRKLIASLTGKQLRLRDGYTQSSVVGGALICNKALGISTTIPGLVEVVEPEEDHSYHQLYREWKAVRNSFKPNLPEELI